MLCFHPNLKNYEVLSEIIFLIDQSGSMGGSNIIDARNALEKAIRLLPKTTMFNIIGNVLDLSVTQNKLGFGSSYVPLFPTSVSSSEENIKKAIDHTLKIEANLGGTEILQPLSFIYK